MMVGEEAANKIKSIPLSNDTVSRRIKDISFDVKSQLTERLRSCEQFALQLDECTDVSSAAQLLVYVRYLWVQYNYGRLFIFKGTRGESHR